MGDLAWGDAGRLLEDPRSVSAADQICRATSSISSNIAEGYSRDTSKARSTFYEYALGSAREARDRYFKARRALDPATVAHRVSPCTQVIRLTLRMIANERRSNRRVSE